MSATLGRGRAISIPRYETPRIARAAIVVALVAGAAAGVAVGWRATPAQDVELMHLLRAMAVLKLAFVAAAAGATLWRLQAPARPLWLAAYAATSAAMAAGPALIWFSSNIVLASVLLHAGLGVCLVLLWRDEATSTLLRAAVVRRRSRTARS